MRKRFFLIAIIAVMALAGCGSNKSTVLAKAGKHVITLNDFKAVLSNDIYEVLSSGKLNPIHSQHFFSAAIDNKIMYLLALKEGVKIEKNEAYDRSRQVFYSGKGDFLSSVNVSKEEIERLFNEYYLQLLYAEGLRDTMQYSEQDILDYYDKNKAQYIQKPFIKGSRIAVTVDDPGQSIAVFSDLQLLLRKYGRDYDLFKSAVKKKFSERINISENVSFTDVQLKIIFKKSLGEVKNLLNHPAGSFTEPYEINNEIILFFISETEKESREQTYEEIKEELIRGFLDLQLTSLKADKLTTFKSYNPIKVIVENPVSLLKEN
ncbi:hypothetical protein KAJ26_02595 [bacterium]|nr:hypothetical protein [bacterium]